MRRLLVKFKWAITYGIGLVLCEFPILRKYKLHLLSSWMHEDKRKGLDDFFYPKLLSFWFRFKYLSEKDPDKRESLKEILMGKEGGRNWAAHYDRAPLDFESRIGHLTFGKAQPLLPVLDKVLSSTSKPILVTQIGNSSGREISWIAGRNPKHSYIGSDIYPEVIAYSSTHHRLPNLRFKVCSAKEISILLSKEEFHKIIVFSSGSLQYVQPEHLSILFDSLSCFRELQLILLEPASESAGNPEELKGSLWRGNFSYTHNYRFYAERAGLITEKCRIIRPFSPYDDFPMHKNTVHYFYRARTGM